MKSPAASVVLSLLFTVQPALAMTQSPDSSEVRARAALTAEVRAAETAFARTMADRDHAAFLSFLDPETIFFGAAGALRGREAVAAAWKRLYEGDRAPFSWEPETVEVLDSGTLALTSGPVRDPDGREIATFNSIWRRNADGHWKVVFDKGCPRCPDKP